MRSVSAIGAVGRGGFASRLVCRLNATIIISMAHLPPHQSLLFFCSVSSSSFLVILLSFIFIYKILWLTEQRIHTIQFISFHCCLLDAIVPFVHHHNTAHIDGDQRRQIYILWPKYVRTCASTVVVNWNGLQTVIQSSTNTLSNSV